MKKVIWTGYEKSMINPEQIPTGAYKRLVKALKDHPAIQNINLKKADSIITPGIHQVTIAGARLRFLCGFGKPLEEWGSLDQAEKLNSVSIVMKLEFGKHSVLFCGDAVGREKDDDEEALKATEHFLVENAAAWLKSTVIIAPHHGASNGSATKFVRLVDPEAVVFSAGSDNEHPTTRTAGVYQKIVDKKKMSRRTGCISFVGALLCLAG